MAATKQIATTPAISTPGQALERARQFWNGRTSRQKIYLGAVLAVALAVVVVCVELASTPDMKTLMTGLEVADAQSLGAQLAAKKIPYVIAPDGTSVSVPADQLDAARVEIASHDQPHSGRIGYEIFDKASWGQTEFDEKVNYQRALEGELERTIQTMSSVKSARVHLVMASSSVFLDRDRSAKASVTLRLKRGTLTREQLEAISRLVAGAVDNLKASDVSIIDADSNQSMGIASGSEAQSDSLERELAARLVATLSPIVGADHLHASVMGDGVTSGANNTAITTTIKALSATSLGLNADVLTDTTSAQTALADVTAAINQISAQRGAIGASVNRLNAASAVMSNDVQNLQSAANSIQNADIGKTVANMTQYNVLQSTGMAALQQSNQAQQAVLKLVQ